MTVQRVPQVPFAQIANSALRDKRLSFKARGVLALVLSHSGEWRATARWLESQSEQDGRAAIQTALNELTDLGYRSVVREQLDGEIRTVVVWRHAPELSISRPTENLTVRKPDGQKSGVSIEHNSIEHNSLEHKQILGFDDFWSMYPRKAAKGAALKAWASAVKKCDPVDLVAAAKRYRDDPNRSDEFTAHASTWLNQERWTDEPLPGKSVRTGGQARMDGYQVLFDQFSGREIES